MEVFCEEKCKFEMVEQVALQATFTLKIVLWDRSLLAS